MRSARSPNVADIHAYGSTGDERWGLSVGKGQPQASLGNGARRDTPLSLSVVCKREPHARRSRSLRVNRAALGLPLAREAKSPRTIKHPACTSNALARRHQLETDFSWKPRAPDGVIQNGNTGHRNPACSRHEGVTNSGQISQRRGATGSNVLSSRKKALKKLTHTAASVVSADGGAKARRMASGRGVAGGKVSPWQLKLG